MKHKNVLRVQAEVEVEVAASVAVAVAVVADTEIVNPDGARDTSQSRGTTIRYITEPGAIPAFFVLALRHWC